MTTLYQRAAKSSSRDIAGRIGPERRRYRRHDLEQQGIAVDRWAGAEHNAQPFGRIVDLSAGGVRIRTNDSSVRPDNQIRLRLELPAYAGICPFVDTAAGEPQPARQWVGWMAVCRVSSTGDNQFDIAGTLVDMEELDRGMLGLYLSTQPLAA